MAISSLIYYERRNKSRGEINPHNPNLMTRMLEISINVQWKTKKIMIN